MSDRNFVCHTISNTDFRITEATVALPFVLILSKHVKASAFSASSRQVSTSRVQTDGFVRQDSERFIRSGGSLSLWSCDIFLDIIDRIETIWLPVSKRLVLSSSLGGHGMKVLHTSDWHLGQLLKQQKRDEEHRAFLTWLLDTLKEEAIELLLIAGDIFDSGLPPNYALEMYYSFLSRCAEQGCRSVIVVGGNHDSPATLHAPKPVLKAINVTVTAIRDREQPDNDLVLVHDAAGDPAVLVCAIPFLRDQDVYIPQAGEQGDIRTQGIIRGTAEWYRRQVDLALARRQELGRPDLPIIATGHLFAEGASLAGSERELYVGNLGAFPAACFPDEAVYVALGHLHRPQTVPNHPRVRYSGSPVPCSFDEATHEKQVLVFDSAAPADVRSLAIPVFRRLATVRGDLATIGRQMNELDHALLKTWVYAEYTGDTLMPDLEDRVNDMAKDLSAVIIGCQDISHRVKVPGETQGHATELTPQEVFELCVERSELSPEDRVQAREAFQEIYLEVCERGNA